MKFIRIGYFVVGVSVVTLTLLTASYVADFIGKGDEYLAMLTRWSESKSLQGQGILK